MMSRKRIAICAAGRARAAESVARVLKGKEAISEAEFRDKLKEDLFRPPFHPRGWYDPPPGGIAALFGNPRDNFARLRFDTLRKEEFWPGAERFADRSVGVLYASLVDAETGTICDWGATVYRGGDPRIEEHMRNCLAAVEDTADFCAVGMAFREIHDFAQSRMKERGLTNARTVTYTDTTGTNIGHTVPWTHDDPAPEELSIIAGEDFDALKDMISKKRIYLNKQERFAVPRTVAFTTEIRAESVSDPTLPNVFFHIVVAFEDGKKTIHENFRPVFQALGMAGFLESRFN